MSAPAIAAIQARVADRYGVDLSEMLSHRKARKTVRPRQVAMYLAKQMTPCSLPVIGRAFGRHHTTVMHAVRRVEELMAGDAAFAAAVGALRDQMDERRAPRPAAREALGAAAQALRATVEARIRRLQRLVADIDALAAEAATSDADLAGAVERLRAAPGSAGGGVRGGPARRTCLRCNKAFDSAGPANRVCKSCRRENGRVSPMMEGRSA